MTRKIGFYKKNDSWYADLPEFIAIGGTEAECQMVRGADTLLDQLVYNALTNNINYLVLEISDEEDLGNTMIQVQKDNFGSVYIVKEYDKTKINHLLWLCPVTLSVFDNYPKRIYFRVIERRENFTVTLAKTSILKKIWHIAKITPRFIKKLLKRR
jgi:hypothetical protein